MAPNATKHNPSWMDRVFHFMLPSGGEAIALIAAEVALTVAGIPVGAHLAVGVLLHLLIAALGPAH